MTIQYVNEPHVFYEINENKAQIFVNISESNSQAKALEQKFENNKMDYYSFSAGHTRIYNKSTLIF